MPYQFTVLLRTCYHEKDYTRICGRKIFWLILDMDKTSWILTILIVTGTLVAIFQLFTVNRESFFRYHASKAG
jgi:hypothetical protein